MAKKLFYSSTDADTLAASDFAGAHLYASDTKLTSTLVGAKQSLDVYVANGIAVDLNGIYDGVTNLTPDNVGLIGHTRSATPSAVEQIERSTVGVANADDIVAANVHGLDVMSFGMVFDGTTWDRLRGTSGAVNIHDGGNSITVDATQLDIDDLNATDDAVQAWAFDGTGNAIGSTTGSLNVNITNASVTVSDAALANTAIAVGAVSVTTTSATLGTLYLYNNGSKAVDIGPSGVASGAGFPIYPGVYFDMRVGPAVVVHADAVSGTQDIRKLELS
jgi:hypothetical protein